jgi:hydroxyethylthiazole kinase
MASKLNITVAMSGASDFVSDGKRTVMVHNGHPLMGRVSGTGCMASSVIGAFSGVCKDCLEATVSAFAAFDIAGELAAIKSNGPGTFKPALFDATARLRMEDILERAKVREV